MKKDPYQRRVKEILTQELVTVEADDSLHDALELMAENRVTALPVLDHKGRCVGILSASDFVELIRDLDDEMRDLGRVEELSHQWILDRFDKHDLTARLVSEFMTLNVATITSEQTLAEAAREMLRHKVHRLPVVKKDGTLLGIVSTMDLLGGFVEGAP